MFACKKATRKKRIKLTIGVNFWQIFRTIFGAEMYGTFFVGPTEFGINATRAMLTTQIMCWIFSLNVNFINILLSHIAPIFWRQKLQSWNVTKESWAKHFCTKNAWVKCWWDWLQMFVKQVVFLLSRNAFDFALCTICLVKLTPFINTFQKELYYRKGWCWKDGWKH